ncbi:hypothetical protein [Peredibacter starrii]|uniref:Uncharacterized protein n=1 Tax=Peredibacter starrii TaxID=28202 RepID=A0AAX4HU40_9BACT|nr:hypothetical protein [Peredibacter starrii]WPU66797.1 hypothetical protein SOO65_08555 [Peredibacter starrii]
MKALIVAVALIASAQSFAAGYVTQSFSKIFYAPTEAELVEKVEAAIPSIQAGEDKELTRSMEFQACSPIHPRHIKIGKLFIKKRYTTVDGVLVPNYRGMLIVSHNRCFESNH